MELSSLRYFLAVANEGNLVRAAKSLYVTQPALSRQIKNLEEELGAKLFTREPRGLTLTEQGRYLRQRAEEILTMADAIKADLSEETDDLAGLVSIGVGESYTSGFIARVARELQVEHPGICYRIYDGNADILVDMLDRGLLDFCILIQPADLSRYGHLRIPEKDTWGLLMRKDNPLASKESVTRADLLGEKLILSEQTMEKNLSSNSFIDWFGEDYELLDVVATYNLIFNATLFVAEGFGSVVSLEKQIRADEADILRFVPFEPRLEVESDIVWKRHRQLSPSAEAFLEAAKIELGIVE